MPVPRFFLLHQTCLKLSNAFQLLNQMPHPKMSSKSTPTGIKRCRTTIISLLSNSIKPSDVSSGRRLHCLIVKYGFSPDSFVYTTLVDMYSKCGIVRDACRMFEEISTRDIVLWNVLVSCYAMNGIGELAFRAFSWMRLEGFIGDGFTFSSLLSSCSSSGGIQRGKQTHCLVIKLSFDSDLVVGTALVDMYVKCDNITDACSVFDLMEARNVVTWNAIIVGCGRNGDGRETMRLFRWMLDEDCKPDELTLAAVLSSTADSAAASQASQVHNYVMRTGFEAHSSVGNALIHAYAKSGYIDTALRCFCLISQPDLVTWSSMIFSYAFHGLVQEAIDSFERMLHQGVRPDGIVFIAVLSACSHAGLVERGLMYFDSMKKDYQIEPVLEHYTSLVDLLARFGHLHEARDVIANMPFEPGGDVLGAFIGACKVHGDIGLARWAADRLLRLEPAETVNYMLLSNSYAALGCWNEVAKIRKIMREKCGNKVAGLSWIEIDGAVNTFVSGDRSHRQAPDIYLLLGFLITVMKDDGYMNELMLTVIN